MHSYYFQAPTRVVRDSEWSVDIYGPSFIYIAQQNLNDDQELAKNDWEKQPGEIIISSGTISHIWKKRLPNGNINTIGLPKTQMSNMERIIFIKGIWVISDMIIKAIFYDH